jgi:hypothetical protein
MLMMGVREVRVLVAEPNMDVAMRVSFTGWV